MKYKKKTIYSTGKKKTSIARVFIRRGSGVVVINKLFNYFNNNRMMNIILKPLDMFNLRNKVNIYVKVIGGGISSQSISIRYAISKSIIKLFKNNFIKNKLKCENLLTRDSRIVERKKIGKKKARKNEQYSKR